MTAVTQHDDIDTLEREYAEYLAARLKLTFSFNDWHSSIYGNTIDGEPLIPPAPSQAGISAAISTVGRVVEEKHR